jgi:prolyl oligopeptidase PreP (S9A serine peptidase family)
MDAPSRISDRYAALNENLVERGVCVPERAARLGRSRGGAVLTGCNDIIY